MASKRDKTKSLDEVVGELRSGMTIAWAAGGDLAASRWPSCVRFCVRTSRT